jgi:hypothetical protein
MKKLIFALLAFSFLPIYASEGIIINTPIDVIGLDIKVDKNTTEKELELLKSDLAKDHIGFSYKTLRNTDGEIIKINLSLTIRNSTGKNFTETYTDEGQSPIKPIRIQLDAANKRVNFLSDAQSLGIPGRNMNLGSGAKTAIIYAQDQDVYTLQNSNLGTNLHESDAQRTHLTSIRNGDKNANNGNLKKSEHSNFDQDIPSLTGANSMPEKKMSKASSKSSADQTRGKTRQSHDSDQDGNRD